MKKVAYKASIANMSVYDAGAHMAAIANMSVCDVGDELLLKCQGAASVAEKGAQFGAF